MAENRTGRRVAPVAVAVQCGRGTIGLARKLSRAALIALVQEKVAEGQGGSTRCMRAAALATACMSNCWKPAPLPLLPLRCDSTWSGGARTIGVDARELCLRLARYLEGQREELKLIRVPRRAEPERRELGRQREFWKREVRRLENHGRALRIEHEHETLPAGWAGARKWQRVQGELGNFILGQLEPLVAQIRAAQRQLHGLTEQIEALVRGEELPIGLGALTVSLLDAEVCDWQRFRHRKAIGSDTGCCPSEHSSGRDLALWSDRPARQ